jgi:molecular chaperone GrpE
VTQDPRQNSSGARPGAAQPHRPGPGEAGSEPFVIRDKRKIKVSDAKHTTGQAGQQAADPAAAGAAGGPQHKEATVGDAQPGKSAGAGGTDEADVVVIEPGGEAAKAGQVDTESVPTGLGAELESLRKALDERTNDLQRLSAEFANYRKRVERDRASIVEQATGNVLGALLPALDDLDRARDHGDLVGPFGSVADQLVATLTKFGLTPFGAKGDPFDPTRHEAVAHSTSADVTESTCVDVMRRGYLLGERLLRPALVAVADPE